MNTSNKGENCQPHKESRGEAAAAPLYCPKGTTWAENIFCGTFSCDTSLSELILNWKSIRKMERFCNSPLWVHRDTPDIYWHESYFLIWSFTALKSGKWMLGLSTKRGWVPHVHRELLLHLRQLAWPILGWPLRPWDICARDLLIGVWQVFVWGILLIFPSINVIIK